jgi:enediyne biosynthesis protein E4
MVTDDSSPNYLYLNKGDGTFQDASFYSGFALNQDARETASMGLAVGDYMNNGRLDLYTTTFSDDYKTLYRNDGDGNFVDITPQMGIAEATYPFPELGHAVLRLRQRRLEGPDVCQRACLSPGGQHDWGTSFAERPLLFHNVDHGKKFEIMPAVEGTGWPT